MARYLGPKCKLSRREGTDLFLKSRARPIETKCQIDKTYIIAEIGVNHNGSFDNAVKLVRKAKKCGANAVKFQIFDASELSKKDAKLAPYQSKNMKKNISQFAMLKSLELKISDYHSFDKKLIKVYIIL